MIENIAQFEFVFRQKRGGVELMIYGPVMYAPA